MSGLFADEIAAMRERSSTFEILSRYDRGLMTAMEVPSAAWQACYDRPELQAVLTRQFRAHPSEYIPDLVGGELEQLAATAAARRAAGGEA